MLRKVSALCGKYRIWDRSLTDAVDKAVTNVILLGDISKTLSTTLGILTFVLTRDRRCTKVLLSDEETPSGATETELIRSGLPPRRRSIGSAAFGENGSLTLGTWFAVDRWSDHFGETA